MRQILNHWYISNNTLSISFMRFFVEVKIKYDNCIIMEVYSDIHHKLTLYFVTLEDAIIFAEEIVNKCTALEEIEEKYKNGDDKSPKIYTKK